MEPTQLADALGNIADDLDDLGQAHQEAGHAVLDSTRAPRVTGALAASLTVEATHGVTTVGSDLVYSGVIHGGWAARNIRPQPFLTDALEATTDQVVDIFTTHVTDIIRKA